MAEEIKPAEFLTFASDIVAAYLSKNKVTAAGLPPLISDVHHSLAEVSADEAAPKPARRR